MLKTIFVVTLLASSFSSFAACEENIQLKIDQLNARIKGISLVKHMAIGAGVGGAAGMGVSMAQSSVRNNYVNGYNAGATPGTGNAEYNAGFQAGNNGQTGADYLDGYQQGSSGQSNVPAKPNYVLNTGVGMGSGAAVGASTFFIKKMILKKKRNQLETILYAYEDLADDGALAEAAKILVPKKKRDNLDDLRLKMNSFAELYCGNNPHEFTVKALKNFIN